MDNLITAKFTPNSGGTTFELRNILGLSYDISRQPGPNGRVGTMAHDLGYVTIQRRKSLEEKGLANLEGETVKLAGATAKNAYFKGEITMARADQPTNVVQTIRWDEGHICGISCTTHGNEITETIQICVTELKIDDSVFRRTATS